MTVINLPFYTMDYYPLKGGYWNFPKEPGIYAIYNSINHKFYIGSAGNLHDRLREHERSLSINSHYNPHLQNSLNVHGIDNFKIVIVEYLTDDKLREREQYYIDTYTPQYNISKNAKAPMKGKHHTEESKAKLRKASNGKHPTEETIRKGVNSRMRKTLETGIPYNAKVKPEEVKDIRKMKSEGIRNKDIFEKYPHMSEGNIISIWRFKSWKRLK